MPFVRQGKKGKGPHPSAERARDEAASIDAAVRMARQHLAGGGACLAVSVLVWRLLSTSLPARQFVLRLGALTVWPTRQPDDRTIFDPRDDAGQPPEHDGPLPDGAGFHAWVEDARGTVVDPSIFATLRGMGYPTNPAEVAVGSGRRFSSAGWSFRYELRPELELLNLDESEAELTRLADPAIAGRGYAGGHLDLDVAWRSARPR